MDTTDYKKKLEAEKEKLEAEMGGIGRVNHGVHDDWEFIPQETGMEADILDQAEINMSQENGSAIFADLEARYDTVISALDRIKNGAYGMCETCGMEIEEARLAANPSAMTCKKHL